MKSSPYVAPSPTDKAVSEADLPPSDHSLAELTADIVAAYVTKNSVGPSELPRLIAEVHAALSALDSTVEPAASEEPKPAVPIRRSVQPDFIICLEDGKKFKSLKRHLALLGMTPAEYRTKWGLPSTYPMVAPSYSATRSQLAVTIGLGRKAAAPIPKGRKKSAAAK